MRRIIGPYELTQDTPDDEITIYDMKNNKVLSPENEIARKIIRDYNFQTDNPERYFRMNNTVVREFLPSILDDEIEYLFIPEKTYGIDENCLDVPCVKYVSLTDSLKVLWNGAFCDFNGLKSIDIPPSVTMIDDEVFIQCRSLEEVNLPNIDRIGAALFQHCVSLKEIVIPDTVEIIDEGAFYLCENLERVVLPKNLKRICGRAFGECKNLIDINISETIGYIAADAFDGCNKLDIAKIPILN